MTTAITIDAHAGWDIEVTVRYLMENNEYPQQHLKLTESIYKDQTFIIKAGTKHTEHIWDNKIIVNIKEVKR
jgi:hypothetical protein